MLTFGFSSVYYGHVLRMETLINESIKVWAVFDSGISPVAMNWRNRLIKFKKVIFTSNSTKGKTKITTLVCTNNNAAYELEYNHQNFAWTLKKIMPKG